MNINKITYCITIIGFLLFSCNKENLVERINLDKSAEKDINLTNIGDSVKYIVLDNYKILDKIPIIRICEKYIFIWSYSDGLLKYSEDGKFISQIGAIGRGPNEYGKYSSFDINSILEEIYILSWEKIYVYHFNGKFLREIDFEVGYFMHQIDFLPPNKLILSTFNSYGDSPLNWMTIDINGVTISEKKNYIKFKPKELFGIIPSLITFKFDNCIFYYEQMNDTIFKINSFGIVNPEYVFENTNDRLTPEVYKNGLLNISSYNIPKSILETPRYLMILSSKSSKEKLFMFDKKKKYLINTKQGLSSIYNNYDNGLSFIPTIITNNNWGVQVLYAYELKAHVASKAFKNSTPKYPEKKKELVQLANSLNENDNPVLMMVKLKD